jgi:hypothetical protein
MVLEIGSVAKLSFGGLVVSMLASGTQDHGFKPDRSRWIFWAKKYSVPSFKWEVKSSAPCRRFEACKKTPAIHVEVGIAGKIYRPFLAQFRHSLTEVSHVTWRGAPLEMTGGTKGGAQRAISLRPRCIREADPRIATHIYLTSGKQLREGIQPELFNAAGRAEREATCNLFLTLQTML